MRRPMDFWTTRCLRIAGLCAGLGAGLGSPAAADEPLGYLYNDTEVTWLLTLERASGSGEGYIGVDRVVSRIQLPMAMFELEKSSDQLVEVGPQCMVSFSPPAYTGWFGAEAVFKLTTPRTAGKPGDAILEAKPGVPEEHIQASVHVRWEPLRTGTRGSFFGPGESAEPDQDAKSVPLLETKPVLNLNMWSRFEKGIRQDGYMLVRDGGRAHWFLQPDPTYGCMCVIL